MISINTKLIILCKTGESQIEPSIGWDPARGLSCADRCFIEYRIEFGCDSLLFYNDYSEVYESCHFIQRYFHSLRNLENQISNGNNTIKSLIF